MREIKKREEADPKDCWKMEDMFPSDEAWEASFLKLKEEAEDFRSRKGTFAAGPREFYQALQYHYLMVKDLSICLKMQ